jgi:hypothetical protein
LVKDGGNCSWYSLIFEDKIVGEIEIESKVLEGELEPTEEPTEGAEVKEAASEQEAMANAPPGYVPPPIAVAQAAPMQFTAPMPVAMAPTVIAAPVY